MTDRVLLTMDDLEVAVRANAAFEQAGFDTTLVSSQDDARDVFERAEPDVVILTGALLEHRAETLVALARDRSVSTLGLVEEATPDPTQQARHLNLTAWMVKPADPGDIVAAAGRLITRRRLQERTGIIGESPAIQEVLVKIEQMAPVSSTVLVEGESGTGKELVAHAIHHLSPRRDGPFVPVNCAALPETLLESELFGHEKGSFTGAAERRLGRFELADGGTIFLDEIAEMPPALQVKLLRVLEDHSFFRVGGTQPIRVNVRAIAATNQPLKEVVALGEFREDLFFRLNVLSIYLPPLRERKRDIPILVERFINELSAQHGRSFVGITPEAMQILVDAHWPGNVRQLRNLIESMVVLAPGREIGPSDIPADVREAGTRLLPMRVPGGTQSVPGKELEFIFRSLVELKLQIEELRRRMDEVPQRVEVVDFGRRPYEEVPLGEVVLGVEVGTGAKEDEGERDDRLRVVYRPGMKMVDVERAAIEAALAETRGNRRRAAEKLGIGERTLYRKIKEYELA
ncbi:MAG: AAA domain-containing protein [Gemmatimonadales bacterium]|nr:AAA domain-containing protein [Gemmatimonadales bacterium]NIN11474.1 AAA domain-containing protein [Gemmatimonadales bacterium]NIN50083.1 AAA domain-containing protein [Gemmatimonadales bacterium]NIP07547.1 AAA domain-containing protein [Gemmatimonadales bacterium]NIR03189.1 AAA domain-containing protein [Gemmatimonadales bacterium]